MRSNNRSESILDYGNSNRDAANDVVDVQGEASLFSQNTSSMSSFSSQGFSTSRFSEDSTQLYSFVRHQCISTQVNEYLASTRNSNILGKLTVASDPIVSLALPSIAILQKEPNPPQFKNAYTIIQRNYTDFDMCHRPNTENLSGLPSGSVFPSENISEISNALTPTHKEFKEISSLFYQENFNLKDPKFLESVLEALGGSSVPLKVMSDQVLSFVETLESRLMYAIHSRSDSFYQSLSSLRKLYERVQKSCDFLATMQIQCNTIDRQLTEGPIMVLTNQARRQHLQEISHHISQLRDILATRDQISGLLKENKVYDALIIVRATLERLNQFDLPSLKNYTQWLMEQNMNIIRLLREQLFDTLYGPIFVPRELDLQSSLFNASTFQRENLKNQLRNLYLRKPSVPDFHAQEIISKLQNLRSVNQLEESLGPIHSECQNRLKLFFNNFISVRLQYLKDLSISETENDVKGKAGPLEGAIRSLPPELFYDLVLYTLYSIITTGDMLQQTNRELICQITTDDSEIQSFIHSLFFEVNQSMADILFGRFIKLLSMRAEYDVSPVETTAQFLSLATTLYSEPEEVGDAILAKFFYSMNLGSSGSSLSCLLERLGFTKRISEIESIVIVWLNHLHTSFFKQLQVVMERDDWSAIEFKADYQELLSHIISMDRLALFILSEQQSSQLKILKLENSYLLSTSSCFLFDVVKEMLLILYYLPSMACEMMPFILKLFSSYNSKLCQLILGAGVIKSAVKLPRVSVRHLAFAAQMIDLLILLLPRLYELVYLIGQEFEESPGCKGKMKGHFQVTDRINLEKQKDKKAAIEESMVNYEKIIITHDIQQVVLDMENHKGELYEKMVLVMKERIELHTFNLLKVDWDSLSSENASDENNMSENDVNDYMKTMTKEIILFYRIVSEILTSSCQILLERVMSTATEKLTTMYKRVSFTTDIAKERMLLDIRYLYKSLKNIEIDNMDTIFTIWKQLEGDVISLEKKDKAINLAVSQQHGPADGLSSATILKSSTAFFSTLFPNYKKDDN